MSHIKSTGIVSAYCFTIGKNQNWI